MSKGSKPAMEAINFYENERRNGVGIWGVRGHGEIGFHFHYKPLLRREIRILAPVRVRGSP